MAMAMACADGVLGPGDGVAVSVMDMGLWDDGCDCESIVINIGIYSFLLWSLSNLQNGGNTTSSCCPCHGRPFSRWIVNNSAISITVTITITT